MRAEESNEQMARRIESLAGARLRESSELAGHPITCRFRDGKLTLCGHVPTYSLKQAAWSAVQRIDGVTAVENRIDVIPLPFS